MAYPRSNTNFDCCFRWQHRLPSWYVSFSSQNKEAQVLYRNSRNSWCPDIIVPAYAVRSSHRVEYHVMNLRSKSIMKSIIGFEKTCYHCALLRRCIKMRMFSLSEARSARLRMLVKLTVNSNYECWQNQLQIVTAY